MVRWSVKCLTISLLVLFNLWALFECLLYANYKGKAWQQAWLLNVIINIIVDICFNNVTEVIFLHYFIPRSIVAEASSIQMTLRSVVESIYAEEEEEEEEDDLNNSTDTSALVPRNKIFSAPEYLFVSVQVAKLLPGLLESVLVRCYRSPFPQEKVLRDVRRAETLDLDEKNDNEDGGEGRRLNNSSQNGFLSSATSLATTAVKFITALIIFTFQYIGSFSMLTQKLILHFIQPMIVGGISIAMIFMTSTSAIAIAATVVVLGIVSLWHWELIPCYERKKKKKLAPITPLMTKSTVIVQHMQDYSRATRLKMNDGVEKGNLDKLNHSSDNSRSSDSRISKVDEIGGGKLHNPLTPPFAMVQFDDGDNAVDEERALLIEVGRKIEDGDDDSDEDISADDSIEDISGDDSIEEGAVDDWDDNMTLSEVSLEQCEEVSDKSNPTSLSMKYSLWVDALDEKGSDRDSL